VGRTPLLIIIIAQLATTKETISTDYFLVSTNPSRVANWHFEMSDNSNLALLEPFGSEHLGMTVGGFLVWRYVSAS